MTTFKKAKTVLRIVRDCKDHTTISVFAFLDLRIGIVDEISDILEIPYQIHASAWASKSVKMASKEDYYRVREESTLCQINSVPSLTSSSSRKNIITGSDKENIVKIYPQWMTSDR